MASTVHSVVPTAHSSTQLHAPAVHVPDEHVPQSTLRGSPQLSAAACAPHSNPTRMHSAASVSAVQVPTPHTSGASTPQASPSGHVPQASVAPQPSAISPQSAPTAAHVVGVHVVSSGWLVPHATNRVRIQARIPVERRSPADREGFPAGHSSSHP
jgi:hypothetical protein